MNPVPAAVSVALWAPLVGEIDHEGVAVKVEVVVMVLAPSYAVKDSGVFGDAQMVSVQLKVPVALVPAQVAPEKITAAMLTAAKVIEWGPAKPVPVAVSVAGKVPLIGVNDHEGVAVNDVEEVINGLTPSLAANVSGESTAAVTVIEQVKLPFAEELQPAAVNETALGFEAVKAIGWFAAKPVPVAVSVTGRVPLVGEKLHEGAAVNIVVVVTPSIVNDSGVLGDSDSVIVQLRDPVASVLHAPTVKVTALGFTAATVGLDSLAANPVPVAVSVDGSVVELHVNDQDGAAVNDEVEVGVFVPSLATNVCGVSGDAVTVIVQVKLPVASVRHAL